MKFAKRSFIFPVALFVVLTLVPTLPAQTQTLVVLHNFTGAPDGAGPHGPLLFDQAGNLYGMTRRWAVPASAQFSSWTRAATNPCFTALPARRMGHSLRLGWCGTPREICTGQPPLVVICDLPISYGCGTVFKLDPSGTETVLHRFGSEAPTGPVPRDPWP